MAISEFDLESIIRDLREAIDGDVCSRSRVVDALLDLRLDAAARTDVVELVDQALSDVPGKNMVAAGWWRDQLDMFELVAINGQDATIAKFLMEYTFANTKTFAITFRFKTR